MIDFFPSLLSLLNNIATGSHKSLLFHQRYALLRKSMVDRLGNRVINKNIFSNFLYMVHK